MLCSKFSGFEKCSLNHSQSNVIFTLWPGPKASSRRCSLLSFGNDKTKEILTPRFPFRLLNESKRCTEQNVKGLGYQNAFHFCFHGSNAIQALAHTHTIYIGMTSHHIIFVIDFVWRNSQTVRKQCQA